MDLVPCVQIRVYEKVKIILEDQHPDPIPYIQILSSTSGFGHQRPDLDPLYILISPHPTYGSGPLSPNPAPLHPDPAPLRLDPALHIQIRPSYTRIQPLYIRIRPLYVKIRPP
jgi:hypothetical protein